VTSIGTDANYPKTEGSAPGVRARGASVVAEDGAGAALVGDASAIFAQVFGSRLSSIVSSPTLLRAGASAGLSGGDVLSERAGSAGARAVSGLTQSVSERASASLAEAAEGRTIVPARGGDGAMSGGRKGAHAARFSARDAGGTGSGSSHGATPRAGESVPTASAGSNTGNPVHSSVFAAPDNTHAGAASSHAAQGRAGVNANASAGTAAVGAASGAASLASNAATNTASTSSAPASGANAVAGVGRAESARPGVTLSQKPGQTPSSRGQEAQLAAQVQRGLFAALRQQGGSVTMRLAPDALGSLTVRLAVRGARVEATFEPSSARAQELLERSVQTLRSALESKGLAVDRITVQAAPVSTDRGAAFGGGAEHGGSTSGERASGERASGSGGDPWSAPEREDARGQDPGAGSAPHGSARGGRVTDDADPDPSRDASEHAARTVGGADGQDHLAGSGVGGAVLRLDRVI